MAASTIDEVICNLCVPAGEGTSPEGEKVVYYQCRRFQPFGQPCVLEIPVANPGAYRTLSMRSFARRNHALSS